MGKIKVMFLCLLIGITGIAFFLMNTKPDPALRELGAAYEIHQEQLKKSPRDPQLLYNEAWFLAKAKKHAEALVFIQKSLQYAPNKARSLYTRAWIYEQQGENAKAAKDITQAKALPFEPQSLTESLRIHLLNKTPAEGLKKVNYELAKQLDPPQGLFYWRSLFQEQLQHYEEAIADIERLLPKSEAQPPQVLSGDVHSELLLQRASLYEKLKQHKEALKDLKAVAALENSGLSAEAQQNVESRIFALQRYSDPDSNIAALQNALQDHFQDKNLHYLLIDSLLEKGDLASAKEKLLKARAASPEDPTLWCLQARYQFAEKNSDAARVTLQEAQKRDPGNQNMCVVRETLRQLTDPAQALSYWNAHPAMQAALLPALEHKDFKNLRKSLETL